MTQRITVAGDRPYDVVVGEDLLPLAPGFLPGVRQVAVIHSAPMAVRADAVAAQLSAAGVIPLLMEVPDGEAAKTLAVAESCYRALGAAGFTRTDAVLGLGGGAVTDLAGFVAGTWLRGLAVLHVPTTLLGMVDAAVGGKTAVNTEHGKNLVGVFHPPAGVLCDLTLLATLKPGDYAAGMAEVVKAGFIADPGILDLIEADPGAALRPDAALTEQLVVRAITVKAEVVGRDLREAGPREALNYGHTLAHAIERVEDYRFRHGDAVSIGLCFAAELGRLSGHLDDVTARRHRVVLDSLGLPVSYPSDAWPDLLAAMRSDKKARGDQLRFVVLDGLGKPVILEGPDEGLLLEAFRRLSA